MVFPRCTYSSSSSGRIQFFIDTLSFSFVCASLFRLTSLFLHFDVANFDVFHFVVLHQSTFLGLALNNKFLPVHCVVTRDQCPTSVVLQDGFVILPSQTKFHEIINVVLQKLEGDVGKIDENEHVNGKTIELKR
jgi:hypothetical protein